MAPGGLLNGPRVRTVQLPILHGCGPARERGPSRSRLSGTRPGPAPPLVSPGGGWLGARPEPARAAGRGPDSGGLGASPAPASSMSYSERAPYPLVRALMPVYTAE